MSLLYPVLGIAVLVLVTFDLTVSTLSVKRDGPLTRLLQRSVWTLTGHASFAGVLALLATAALWVGLLWFGWTLVFMGTLDSVVTASTGAPGGFWDRVYFAGYTVATLGLGDFVPQGPVWQMLTVVSVFSGLVLLTLAVTYYGSVVGAVTQQQHLASLIETLGDTPAAIVAGAWDGDSFPGLDTILPSLASMLVLHARRHDAYPMIHYFRATEPNQAFSVQVARLHDALVLMRRVVAERHRPPPVSLRIAYHGIRILVFALHPRFIQPASDAPPIPDLSALRTAGIPVEAGNLADTFAEDDVRRVLRGFVEDDRFSWSDVDPGAAAA